MMRGSASVVRGETPETALTRGKFFRKLFSTVSLIGWLEGEKRDENNSFHKTTVTLFRLIII